MDSILPDRLLALVRPGNNLVLRRIRNLKRCVEACGCKIMTPRYACAPRPRTTRRPCAPARAAASPRPRGSARRCPTRCGPSGRRPGPASRPAKPAGPHVRQQIQAGLPRVAAALHKAQVRQHAVHRPPGTGWAGGRGRWPARCACSAPRPRRRTARLSDTPAPQRREEAAWGSGRTP